MCIFKYTLYIYIIYIFRLKDVELKRYKDEQVEIVLLEIVKRLTKWNYYDEIFFNTS